MRGPAFAILGAALALAMTPAAGAPQVQTGRAAPPSLFETADRCQACHNGLVTPSGADVSIGTDWRASMMAHAARDPYWQAAVRRETLDHPAAAADIEHECSRCHMPMAHVTRVASGGRGEVFANLPVGRSGAPHARLAADGVSCTVCHQIQPDRLGTPESFTGHFVIDTSTPAGDRRVFGPYDVPAGLRRLMHSATAFRPAEGAHVRSSEMCATCHTLYTHTLDAAGAPVGMLPEQVPYLEWQHSRYRDTMSCQVCHMPQVAEPVRMSSTLGEVREGVSRHTFRGANFWMLRVLNRYRGELGVEVLPQELELAAQDTLAHLERESAALRIERAERRDGRLFVELAVANRGGHKLPTAYPSRRVWVHLQVASSDGRIVFESGAVEPSGAIAGNDNDLDPAAYEPHYRVIRRAGEVQIYENIMVTVQGTVTTGLLSGARYVKDNRLLPEGFDKRSAHADIAVHGDAGDDPDFGGGGDRLRYDVPAAEPGPLVVTAELLYQSVGYRWAQNLRAYRAFETDRFVRYYTEMSRIATARLARASVEIR